MEATIFRSLTTVQCFHVLSVFTNWNPGLDSIWKRGIKHCWSFVALLKMKTFKEQPFGYKKQLKNFHELFSVLPSKHIVIQANLPLAPSYQIWNPPPPKKKKLLLIIIARCRKSIAKFCSVTLSRKLNELLTSSTVAAIVSASTETTCVTADHVRPNNFPIYRAIFSFHCVIKFEKWIACPLWATSRVFTPGYVNTETILYFFNHSPISVRVAVPRPPLPPSPPARPVSPCWEGYGYT